MSFHDDAFKAGGFLDEAAALLRLSATDVEQMPSGYESDKRLKREARERVAMKFAQLAAIDKGLLPPDMVAEVLASVMQARQGGAR